MTANQMRSLVVVSLTSVLAATGCPADSTPQVGDDGIDNPGGSDDTNVGTTDTGAPDPDDAGGDTVGQTPGLDSTGEPGDDDEPGVPPIKLDTNHVPDAGIGGFCPVITVESEPTVVPADIIIAVDTSGSMFEEADAVQANLNTFSQQIVDAGVDARVILIASAPNSFDGVCIDPPLGGGGCPATDDNEPLFLHVDQTVFSTDAYERIIDTYPQYMDTLRPEAVKQILIVSDDNSWTGADAFDSDFVALDPTHFGYTQHGIVSMTNCPAAATVGQEYIDLAMTTGGVIGDLCLQDFQPVFDELAAAVVDNSIPCFYALPDAAGGPQDASTAEVEVDFGEGPQPIEPVDTPDLCQEDTDNWFFDNPKDPSSIIFCPFTCLRLKQSLESSVEIAITCAPASD